MVFYFCQKLSYLFIYLLTAWNAGLNTRLYSLGLGTIITFVWEIPNFVLLLFCVFFVCLFVFLWKVFCVTALATLELKRFTCLHLSPPSECWRLMSPLPDINFVLKREAGMEHTHGRNCMVEKVQYPSKVFGLLQVHSSNCYSLLVRDFSRVLRLQPERGSRVQQPHKQSKATTRQQKSGETATN